jgi:hypothetical protein
MSGRQACRSMRLGQVQDEEWQEMMDEIDEMNGYID